MASDNPYSSVHQLTQLISSRVQVQQAVEDLRRNRWVGTVGFFDLVGSTGYRSEHGQDAGLEKTHRHNICVSTMIREHGGEVVKWLGDGVMARFDEVTCGPNHAYKMLQAAVAAIRYLNQLNHDENRRNFEEIHTKVGIASGAFHYVAMAEALSSPASSTGATGEVKDAGTPEASTPSEGGTKLKALLDPIGSAVDLAARLGSMANADVIVVDEDTFWGHHLTDEGAKIDTHIHGMTSAKQVDVAWKKYILNSVRTTVYLPCGAAMLATPDGLKLCNLSQAAKDRIHPDELKKVIDEAALPHPVVYVSKPIKCNARGFRTHKNAIAISLQPSIVPISHAKYQSPPFDANDALKRAESLFRAGENLDDALEEFLKVWRADNRHFHANVRLAMLYRVKRKNDDSLKHLMLAKESDGSCALVWASAAMIHLDNYVAGSTSETREESITRAIVGLTRAKELARDLFHGLLEQYSTCLLAIAYFLRGDKTVDPVTGEDDFLRGVRLAKDMERWPPKNRIVSVVRELASAFQAVVRPHDSTKKEAAERLEGVAKQVEQLRTKGLGQDPVGGFDHDTLVTGRDMNNLLAHGRYVLNLE